MQLVELMNNADSKISELKKLLGYDPTEAPETLLKDKAIKSAIHNEVIKELSEERRDKAKGKYKSALKSLSDAAENLEAKKRAFIKEYEEALKTLEEKSQELHDLGAEIDETSPTK